MSDELQEVKIEVVGQIELEKFPIEKYLGKKVKIVEIKYFENSRFNSFCVKIITEKLGEWVNTEQETKDITASRIFGLQKDKDGKIGWGSETKFGLFLKKMKASKPEELVGMEVITQSVTRTEGDFLTFN